MRNHNIVRPITAFAMALLLMVLSLLDCFGAKDYAYAAGREIMSTVAGTGERGSSGDGGPATSARLNSPQNVVFDSAGNLYISDQNESRVRKVDALTGEISTLAGTGASGDSGDGGQAASAQLNTPYALSFHDGDLYIGGSGTVRKVDFPSETISTVAGNGYCNAGADIGDGGPAISASLCWIRGLAFDSHGNMYISSTNDARVRKVDASTGIISTVAGTGDHGYSAVETSAALAPLSGVAGLAVDDEDNLYIAEEYSVSAGGFIRKVDPSGNISIVAGGGNLETGPATSVNLNGPIGLTFDNGDLFISTYTTILKLDLTAGTISKVAGSGYTGYSGDGGPASAANLFSPNGVAFDGSGYLHIADTRNHVVRRVGLSNEAGLSSLTLSSGSLSPDFSSGTTDYMTVMQSSVSSITVTPTVRDSYATVEVNGTAVTSGTESGAIALNAGDTVTIVVTAEDGTKKTYKVTRTPGSNADLSGMTLSSGTLSPTFAAGTTSYAASVANGVSSITVTPTVSDSTATVKVNGTIVANGSVSGAISLSVGDNPIPVVVTAQDGTTTKTYTVTVTRTPGSNADLSGMTLSSGTLSPTFAAGTTSYATSVANGVSSITVTPTVSDSTATVKVNGTIVANGSASGAISLIVGDNPIPVVVTAQDGTTTKAYTVTVTRAAWITSGGSVSQSNNTNLSGLTLSSGSLSPAFTSGTKSYAASVANSVSSITVTPAVSDSAATVKVNGKTVTSGFASGTISLIVGDNLFTVEVTAQDGTMTTYTVTVTRASDTSSPPASPGPILNEAITNVKKVKDSVLAALSQPAPEQFPDVSTNNWSSQAIEVARQLGIVQGRPDGKFHGSDSITRAEFVAMVVKALSLDTTSEQRGAAFSDTRGHWAEAAIETLRAAGVIEGVGEGSFKPEQPISRAEISAILARLMVFAQTISNVYFSDTSDNWARPYIEQLADADIVRGAGDGKFYPHAYTTREQAAAMIIRMLTVSRNVHLQLT
ncbi:cadherin-like beta sandwich domain-containing protein [Cohnella sp. LGH]|uniref:cadherin-like beta sandwich domain-containing protein n=1 Tax=Cohnella sp. LGH TaxID=1619153 RepID=UPI001ADD5A53|nr:cadherin-like beta sandwich domain-containing protein [Cohnella sp. LGH]QTH42825.1 cadherin-like beta sandwich domain-containing protein [Cohnella sp. LGH]